MNLLLCGMKGVGKTSIGRCLAAKYHRHFMDVDELLLAQYRCKVITSLYRQLGEQGFRQAESTLILNLPIISNCVTALGGGSLMLPRNQQHCRKVFYPIFYLYQNIEQCYARYQTRSLPAYFNKLPSFDQFGEFYYQRDNVFRKVADNMIDLSDKSHHDATEELQEYWLNYGK